MSSKVIYHGEPYPFPTERYILRYWHQGDEVHTVHPNGWHDQTDALAQARAFQNAGWTVQVVDTQAEEG